jgi:hypothetical protein
MDFFMRLLRGSSAIPFFGSGNQQSNMHHSLSRFIFTCFYDFRVHEEYIFHMKVCYTR